MIRKTPWLTAFAVVLVGFIAACSQPKHDQEELRADWDRQVGHPAAAVTVAAGDTAALPKAEDMKWYWPSCGGDKCTHRAISHYPVIYHLASLPFTDNCFTATPPQAPTKVSAAASSRDYRLEFATDGATLRICNITGVNGARKDNKVAIWSDEVPA